jgi:hypothetical protein
MKFLVSGSFYRLQIPAMARMMAFAQYERGLHLENLFSSPRLGGATTTNSGYLPSFCIDYKFQLWHMAAYRLQILAMA